MTTGRINQVTTIHLLWYTGALRPLLMAQSHVHRREFIKLVEELIAPQISVQIPRQTQHEKSVFKSARQTTSVQIRKTNTRKISVQILKQTAWNKAATKTPCSPISQISSALLLVT